MDAQITILVLSAHGQLWDALDACIRTTCYARKVDGIEVIFYYGDAPVSRFDGTNLCLTCDEQYKNMGIRTIEAFEWLLENRPSMQYVFRTNQSSYVRLDKLHDVVGKFNGASVYSGFVGNHEGISFASGCGYWISRDLIKLLVDNKTILEHSYVDDVCFGKFLTSRKVPVLPAMRFDITSLEQLNSISMGDINDHFHFRCKQGYDRSKDVEVMVRLHRLLKDGD